MHPSLFDFDSGNPSKWQAMLSLKKSNIKRLMPLGMRCVCFTFWADSWHHFWWPTSLSWRGPHVYWSWLDVKGYEGLPSARCLAKLPSATQESTYLEAMIVYTESYFFRIGVKWALESVHQANPHVPPWDTCSWVFLDLTWHPFKQTAECTVGDPLALLGVNSQ